MLRSLMIILAVAFAVPLSADGHDTLLVAWSSTPGHLESTIGADTTATGEQAHDVYLLEAGKTYLMLTEMNLNHSLNITGQVPAAGQYPATIQPMPGSDGALGFTNWPNGNFQVYGTGTVLTLKNLLFNGTAVDQSAVLQSLVNTRGEFNKVHIDHTVISNYDLWVHATFGQRNDFIMTNSVAKAFTGYPNGQYFGGITWGGGSWMGTYDTLIIENSTFNHIQGEGVVIFSDVDHGRVDHNTFANVIMNVVWYRGHNNLWVRNNLFYNTKSHMQSTYDISGWGVWHPGGHGKMTVMPDHTKEDTVVHNPDGQVWNHMNRNIKYYNNVWWDSPELTEAMSTTTPWEWEVITTSVDSTDNGDGTMTYDTTTVSTMQADTMLSLATQQRWYGDSTAVTLAQNRGVMEMNNLNVDPGLNLDPGYITQQLARTWDFRDDLASNTPPFDTRFWQYEHDNDYVNVEWPMHIDMSYDPNSAAASASTTGGPVGDPKWMTPGSYWMLGTKDDTHASAVPSEFSLKQNYPNPFNPTTDISFTLDKKSDVSLIVYNMLGQKVRTLVSGSRNAGTHTFKWDGRDNSSKAVSAGVYMYTLSDGTNTITKKMALMK